MISSIKSIMINFNLNLRGILSISLSLFLCYFNDKQKQNLYWQVINRLTNSVKRLTDLEGDLFSKVLD